MDRDGYYLGSRSTGTEPASQRETEVIEFARTFAEGKDQSLPRELAAGKLFFRLDPGFREEVDAARREWVGSCDAPYSAAKSPDWQDENALGSLALDMAARWGLMIGDAANLLATNEAVTFPWFVVRPNLAVHPTGLRRTRLDIYSGAVWDKVSATLRGLGWESLEARPELPSDQFGSGNPFYVGGARSYYFARVVALHFLTQRSDQRLRESGGTRSWIEARSLWTKMTGDNASDGQTRWREMRDKFLKAVGAHRMNPVDRLMAIKCANRLDDAGWVAILSRGQQGLNIRNLAAEWQRVASDRVAEPWFWDLVRRALPDLVDELALDAPVPRGRRQG
jgi:hypothetical protein